jgi:hypothetical protein
MRTRPSPAPVIAKRRGRSAAGERSKVRVQFTFTARRAWTELLVGLIFALNGDRLVGAVLRRWAERIERTSIEPAAAA